MIVLTHLHVSGIKFGSKGDDCEENFATIIRFSGLMKRFCPCTPKPNIRSPDEVLDSWSTYHLDR